MVMKAKSEHWDECPLIRALYLVCSRWNVSMAFFIYEPCRFFFRGCGAQEHSGSRSRTISCRRDPKGGFKHPAEMCLISKTSIQSDLDQRSALGELLAGNVEPPHEQIAVGTGPT